MQNIIFTYRIECICDCFDQQSFLPIQKNFLTKADVSETYDLKSFSVDDMSILLLKKMLLSDKPVSILLYGNSQSGKTEFAKSLAHECNLDAFYFESSIYQDMNFMLRLKQNCRFMLTLSINRKKY